MLTQQNLKSSAIHVNENMNDTMKNDTKPSLKLYSNLVSIQNLKSLLSSSIKTIEEKYISFYYTDNSQSKYDEDMEFQDCEDIKNDTISQNEDDILEEECQDAYSSKEEMMEAIIENYHSKETEYQNKPISKIGFANLPPGIPELPLHYVARPEILSKILKRLRATKSGMIVVISGNYSTVKYTSGLGKSILATATIRHPEVRLLFDGGIFWIHIGNIPGEAYDLELFRIVSDVAKRMQAYICQYDNNPNNNNNNSSNDINNNSLPTFSTLEDCSRIIRDLMRTSQEMSANSNNNSNISISNSNINNSFKNHGENNNSKMLKSSLFLLVLDDVCDERIVHLFQELGFVLLITTRFPDLFSSGNIIGSLLLFEEMDRDFGVDLLASSSRLLAPQQLPREAHQLFEISTNILELSMLGAMAVERGTEPIVWRDIYNKRTSVSSTNKSLKWTEHPSKANWTNTDIIQHKGVFDTMKLSLMGLTPLIQDYYLSLIVLPKGLSVSRSYLSILWDISGEFLSAVLSLLQLRCLIFTESHPPNDVRYYLHDLHVDGLIMQAILQARKLNPGVKLNRSALVIKIAVERMVSYLTDPVILSRNELDSKDGLQHSFSFDCECWLRLELLSQLELCERISPAECFQHRINVQMAACEIGNMCRYIEYACSVLQYHGHFHPTLVIWYKTALDFLERESRTDTPAAAALMNSLGLLLQRLGKHCEAVDVHFKAALVLENIYGSKNINVAITYAHIGVALQALGHIDDAIHMLRKSLFITIETDGVENPTVARTLSTLAHLLSLKGSSCESIAGFEAAVNIFKVSLGPNHPESIMTSAERGIVLLQAGETAAGLEMIEIALVTLKRYGFNEDDPFICRLRGHLKLHRNNEDLCDSVLISCIYKRKE